MQKRTHWRSPLDPSHENFEISETYKELNGEPYLPHENFLLETEEECNQAVITGAATGLVRLNDGTLYDLTPNVILAPKEHHEALAHHISKKHEEMSQRLGDKAPFGSGYKAIGSDNTGSRSA